MSRVEVSIAELEALQGALPREPTIDDVSGYVAARASIVTELAACARSTDARLAPRLERVLARDQALTIPLASRRAEVGEQLRGVFQARTAARGYRGRGESSRLLRKTA